MLRYGLVATVAALATTAVLWTAGAFASSDQRQAKTVTIRPGQAATFVGVDLFCHIEASDPDHHETGPIFFCTRNSATGHSRSIGGSKYHFYVSDESGNYIVYRVARTP